MAISSPSPSRISASLPTTTTTTTKSSRFLHFFPSTFRPPSPRHCHRHRLNLTISSSQNPNHHSLHQTLIPQPRFGSFVYVTLPIDTVDFSGKIKRLKAVKFSLRSLALAGVEGVVMEVWWGMVERDVPLVYDWKGYLDVVALARHFGLKVRVVLGFHEVGLAGDSCWVPLPYWVREAMIEDPDLAYSDRFGRRNKEYISLACDDLPVLRGRSPIQAYSDLMRSFRDTFREYLGVTVTGVQVGMGPSGELRYPSCPSQKLASSWRVRELGEFQCYDRYMIASLNACAQEIGMPAWGNGGPLGTGNLMHNHEETIFFKSEGSWNTPYGRFFLEWYSGMLLLHGERLCIAADNIFSGTRVSISAKIAVLHWHYDTESHPSELTAGYCNTSIRDGYLPITRLFSKYGMIMCCNGFELRDSDEKKLHPLSSPEGLLKQIMLAARASDLRLDAENSGGRLNDQSLQQVLNMSKFYSGGLYDLFFSFNFVRMGQSLFEQQNWAQFTEFVKHISNGSNIQANLNFGGGQLCTSSTSAAKVRAATAYY